MIIDAKTKGRTVGVNPDLMLLVDRGNGSTVVTAARTKGKWTLHADGAKDVTAKTRAEAIYAMTAHAQAATGAENYTNQIQPGLSEQS